jgi:predicted esterase
MWRRTRAYNFAVDIYHVERMPLRHSMFLRIAMVIALMFCADVCASQARTLEHISIGDIPVVISKPASITSATRLVVLFHGFGPPGDPEHLAEAIPLDDTSFFGVYVNMPMVAKRLPAGGIDELRRVQLDDFVNGLYFRSISGAAHELSTIVRFVEKNYGLNSSRGIGLFGFSAGGSAALLSLTQSDVPISCVVVVNAPLSVRQNVIVWERELKRKFAWDEKSDQAAATFDVLAHANDIAHRKPRSAILFLQGDQDEHLATQPVQEAGAALQKSYGADQSKIDVRILPGVSHNFAPVAKDDSGQRISDGALIRDASIAWLEKWLG